VDRARRGRVSVITRRLRALGSASSIGIWSACVHPGQSQSPSIEDVSGATYELDTLPGIRSPRLEIVETRGGYWGRMIGASKVLAANAVKVSADSLTFVAPIAPQPTRVRLGFTAPSRQELKGVAIQTVNGVIQRTPVSARRVAGISPALRSLASIQRFAPGVISSDSGGESFGSMRADSHEFYFTRHTPNWAKHTIMVSTSDDGTHWSTPTVVPFSGQFSDREPRLSPNGLQLWFSSQRPRPGSTAVQRTRDIWLSERASLNSAWSEPRFAPNINTDANEYSPIVTRNGILYFVSDRSGGLGGNDIYSARRDGSGFEQAENLGEAINTSAHETNVFVTSDDQLMIISADERPDSEGGDDLYVSQREGGRWGRTRHLGPPINSFEYEYGPSLTDDGRWLIFTSHRRGAGTLYRVPATLLGINR
jgi:hypothetical protein